MSQLQLPQLGPTPDAPFPPTATALTRPNGLLAWGGDLAPTRLLAAYRQGIFPWYSHGEPILWWSPDPRCVLVPDGLHVSRRTRRRFNTGRFQLTADTAFPDVVAGCAAPRRTGGDGSASIDAGTWITPELKQAFVSLHDAGFAHSVEVWNDGQLVGGVYGMAQGRVFFGESMFSRATDASKIALAALCRQLSAWSFALLDCQVTNPHLLSLGAVELPRHEFESIVADAVGERDMAGPWTDRFEVAPRW